MDAPSCRTGCTVVPKRVRARRVTTPGTGTSRATRPRHQQPAPPTACPRVRNHIARRERFPWVPTPAPQNGVLERERSLSATHACPSRRQRRSTVRPRATRRLAGCSDRVSTSQRVRRPWLDPQASRARTRSRHSPRYDHPRSEARRHILIGLAERTIMPLMVRGRAGLGRSSRRSDLRISRWQCV
jgi:hypothetical protein